VTDELLKIVAFGGNVRVVVADSTRAVEELRRIHDSSPTVTAALGRVATGALLLASTLEKVTRREPVLTMRVSGDGPAGTLLATASPAGWLRALVQNPHVTAPGRADGKLDVSAVVGARGTLEVARDLGVGVPYQGVVELVSGEIGEDIAHYLAESEQLRSAVGVGVHVLPEARVAHAGGYLVQLLPGVAEDDAAELETRVRALGAVTTRLREGFTADDIARELFPDGCQILERQRVKFRCGCSQDRVERAVKLLGSGEIRELIVQSRTEPVYLTCHFCRRSYPVTPVTLHRLLQELSHEASANDGRAQA
jgi:molecular chaperone Hsp33